MLTWPTATSLRSFAHFSVRTILSESSQKEDAHSLPEVVSSLLALLLQGLAYGLLHLLPKRCVLQSSGQWHDTYLVCITCQAFPVWGVQDHGRSKVGACRPPEAVSYRMRGRKCL